MALTITRVSDADSVFGNKRIKIRDVEFDSSYPTGGEPLVASDVDLDVIDQVIPNGPAGDSDGSASTLAWLVRYDHVNETLQMFGHDPTDATAGVHGLPEADSAENLTDHVVRVMFIGH